MTQDAVTPEDKTIRTNNTHAVLHGRVSNRTHEHTNTATGPLSYSVTTTTEVTQDPRDTELCGGSLCVACLMARPWFCTLFRETIVGRKRVSQCRASQPASATAEDPSSTSKDAGMKSATHEPKRLLSKHTWTLRDPSERLVPSACVSLRNTARKHETGYSFIPHLDEDGPYVTIKSAHAFKMIQSYETSALMHAAALRVFFHQHTMRVVQKHVFVFSTLVGIDSFKLGKAKYHARAYMEIITGKTPQRDRNAVLSESGFVDIPVITTTAMLDTVLASIPAGRVVHVHWCTLVRSPLLNAQRTRHPKFCHVYVSNYAEAFEAGCLKHIILGLARQEKGVGNG